MGLFGKSQQRDPKEQVIGSNKLIICLELKNFPANIDVNEAKTYIEYVILLERRSYHKKTLRPTFECFD